MNIGKTSSQQQQHQQRTFLQDLAAAQLIKTYEKTTKHFFSIFQMKGFLWENTCGSRCSVSRV